MKIDAFRALARAWEGKRLSIGMTSGVSLTGTMQGFGVAGEQVVILLQDNERVAHIAVEAIECIEFPGPTDQNTPT